MSDTKVYSALTDVMQSLGARAAARARQKPRWSKVALEDLSAVEELLDWLENNGYEERRVDASGGEFVVRWR